MNHDDQELCDCMEHLAVAFKSGNPPIKAPLRAIIASLVPILLASPDPRVKALALGLQALSTTFLQAKRTRTKGGKA